MERKKQNNKFDMNIYSNLNNTFFNKTKNKKNPIQNSYLNENVKVNLKSKNNKINSSNSRNLKSVNDRLGKEYMANNLKLSNNTYYNNKLHSNTKNTKNKDINKSNNKYVIDYDESIKKARNSSAPTLKQENDVNPNIYKHNRYHDTSRNKKDENNIFKNNKILTQQNNEKNKFTSMYENQKPKKEKEKPDSNNNTNNISNRINRINQIKQNYNSKINKKLFPLNINKITSNKKSYINNNFKDNIYNKTKNKGRKSFQNNKENHGINMNLYKEILEKKENIQKMKQKLKNKEKITSRNRDDINSFFSYKKSYGNNPTSNKNHHNKSYDNSLNNYIQKEINDKTTVLNEDNNIEIDNEEKVLNIKEDKIILKINEINEKSNFNKTYENNISLYNETKKSKNEIINENKNSEEKKINTLEIDTINNKNIINTNFNLYNKNKSNKNKEKNIKKDKKIRLVNIPNYKDYYFTKPSNILNMINNNLNKTQIEKNINKSKITDNNINKSKFNESFDIKKNNATITTKRKKINTDLYNNNIKIDNNIKNKEVKKRAINSSKIKKHNVKIKIQPQKIHENRSDNKIKIRKVDKIGCICRPGEISYGKEKINQDNYFNYTMDIDDLVYIGVCDGHGDFGHFISDYLIKNLPKNFQNSYINLKQELDSQYMKIPKEKITHIFEESFSKTDLDLNNFCDKLNRISTSGGIPPENIFNCEYSGSTCVSLLIPNKNTSTIYIANVGDSRAILIKEEKSKKNNKWTFQQLSRDHKPTEEDEYQRIIEADGEIEAIEDDDGNWNGPLRVWEKGSEGPGLAMTRSLGDKVGAKIGVCCTPEVTKFEIKEEDKVIVLASDGLWEYISNEETTDMVKNIYEEMKKNGEIDGDKMAKILYEKAVDRWREKDIGMDDITIICVVLN